VASSSASLALAKQAAQLCLDYKANDVVVLDRDLPGYAD